MSNVLSALSLLMRFIFVADDHDPAVSLDDFALVAHGFDRRSYFHFLSPCIKYFSGDSQDLLRHVILPLVRS